MTTMLSLIAAVSLLLGGIGAMNVMLERLPQDSDAARQSTSAASGE